jgi:hypothetical protein
VMSAVDVLTSAAAIRSRLVDTLRRDLIGPGPKDADLGHERLKNNPSRWYLAGFIAPALEGIPEIDLRLVFLSRFGLRGVSPKIVPHFRCGKTRSEIDAESAKFRGSFRQRCRNFGIRLGSCEAQGQASAALRAREIGYCGIASGVVDRGFATPTPLRSIRIPPRFFGPPCAFRHPPPSMRTPPRFLGGRRVSIYLLFSGLTTKNAKALQAAKCFEPSPRMTSLHLS